MLTMICITILVLNGISGPVVPVLICISLIEMLMEFIWFMVNKS